MAENGITYFKYDKNLYGGDETKYCSLTGDKVDSNFYFLRRMDISTGYFDSGATLHLITIGDDDISISGLSDILPFTDLVFSGSSYDAENGVLDLIINDRILTLSGFSVCNCEKLESSISGLTCRIETLEGISEDYLEFKAKIEGITSGGSESVESLMIKLQTLSGSTSIIRTDLNSLSAFTIGVNEQVKKNTDACTNDIADLKKDLTDEKNRAEGVEKKLSNELTEVSNNVSEQNKQIETISSNVSETMGLAKSALEEVRAHEIDDLVLEDNILKLSFNDPEHKHTSVGVSLENYISLPDGETIVKNEDNSLSVVLNKETGAVSYEKYNELLEKYNELEKEFETYKNQEVYYAGTFTEYHYEAESVLQKKYEAYFDETNKQFSFESEYGNTLLFALPYGMKLSSVKTGDTTVEPMKISESINRFDGKSYTVYAISLGEDSSKWGSKYVVKVNY